MTKLLLVVLFTSFSATQSFALDCGGIDTVWNNNWSARLSDSKIIFNLNEDTKSVNLAVARVEVTSTVTGFEETYSVERTPVAQVVEQTCKVGDETFPRTLYLFVPTRSRVTTYKGCCGIDI